MKRLVIASGAVALTAALAQAPRTHDLTLLPEHVHRRYYDASVKPVLRVA
jgi:hypothetical protein